MANMRLIPWLGRDLIPGEATKRLAQRKHAATAPQSFDAVSLMRLAGMEPDPMQQEVVSASGHHLVLAHRQRGKSQIAASVAFSDALQHPGCLVLIVSRSLRQSRELFRKVRQFYDLLQPCGLKKDTENELELETSSRIISLPGNAETLVGFSSVHRLILEEAARIPDSTYYALRPMLARSGGTILAITTPFGRRGWFYEAWSGENSETNLDVATVERLLADLDFPIGEHSAPGLAMPAELDGTVYQWTKTFAPVTYHPRLSKAYIANERLQVPDLWFRQEWLCEFVELGAVVFPYEDLVAMLADDLTPLFGEHGQVHEGYGVVSDDIQPLALG